jgi:tRNA dimethylallyltransferase
MQAIGYRQIISYLQGKSDKEETIGSIQQATRRYAKRQLTWFRKMPHLYWLHTNDQHQAYDEIIKDLNNFLR